MQVASLAPRSRAILDRPGLRTTRAVPPVGWLIALFLVSAVVYVILGTQHVVFDLVPDELQYVKMSQNFARGAGLNFRGVGVGYPPLWPLVLSWVWHIGSAVNGYQLAKVFGATLACTVVIPVWVLGRELVGPRLALVPAALSVAGAWMVTTALVVSENLAYPLAVASLCCTVMALRDTRARWVLASVAFAVPAALARSQMLVLPVILVLALVLDLARQPRGARWERVRARPTWLWGLLGAGVIALLVAYAADKGLTGYPILSYDVSLGRGLRATGQHALTAINMFAFVPVIAAAALMARGANWRDDSVGPVLVTLVATIAVLFPVLGFYEAFTPGYPVDRYGMYLAPLLFLALVMAPGRIGRPAALAAALAVAVVMVLTPLVKNQLQQPALFGTQRRINALGLAHGNARIGFVVLALVVGGAGAAALLWRDRGRGLAVAAALVAAVLVTQSWTIQSTEISRLHRARHTLAPPQLDWVDQRVNGPVGELNLAVPQTLVRNVNDYTDFYNKRVDRVYTVPYAEDGCRITFANDGSFQQAGGPTCAPWPRYLVIQRSRFFPTLAGQQVLASTPLQGTLVRIPPGAPRLIGVVQPPCEFTFCFGALGITTFLPSPGVIAVTFGPAPGPHVVTLAGVRQWLLPANRQTTLQVSLGSGVHKLVMSVNWSSSQGAPALRAVVLESGGTNTSLYSPP